MDGNSIPVHGLSNVAKSGKASDVQCEAFSDNVSENNVEQVLKKINEIFGNNTDTILSRINKAIQELKLGTASKSNIEDFDKNGEANKVLGSISDASDENTVYGLRKAIEEIESCFVWKDIE